MGGDKQGNRTHLRLAQELPNARMQDATMVAVRSLPSRPEPRWRWDNLASGRSAPWRPLQQMLNDAIDANAPIDEVLAPVRELEGQLRARHAARLTAPEATPLHALSVEETRADAATDIAQAEVAAAPSRPALERLVICVDLQIDRLRHLAAGARRTLSQPVNWRKGMTA